MGIGFGELLIIALAALIFIGPKDLPLVMKNLGSIILKLKKVATEFTEAINKEIDQPKKYIKDLNGNLQETFKLDDIKP